MSKPYKLKKRNDRGGQYAIVDKATGKMKFAGTTDKDEAKSLAELQYGQADSAAFNQKFAEAHLAKCNPEWITNTWDMIAKRMIDGLRGKYGGEKKAGTIGTLKSNWNNLCWDDFRHKRVIDSVPADFTRATKDVGIAMSNFGKKLHNYAMDHRLIPLPIMGAEMWTKHERNARSRSVSGEEHLKILRFINDPNQDSYRQYVKRNQGTTLEQWRYEWVNWLWFLWFTGASRSPSTPSQAPGHPVPITSRLMASTRPVSPATNTPRAPSPMAPRVNTSPTASPMKRSGSSRPTRTSPSS